MMENFNVAQVFKQEKTIDKRMAELRRISLQMSGLPISRIMEIGIEWQEATGKLLMRDSMTRQAGEEKLEDAERRKTELQRFTKSGRLK
jgi:hypothetical protein